MEIVVAAANRRSIIPASLGRKKPSFGPLSADGVTSFISGTPLERKKIRFSPKKVILGGGSRDGKAAMVRFARQTCRLTLAAETVRRNPRQP
jgi:hypothetical protein